MPNLGSTLKQEIARITRRELKVQIQTAKKVTTQHRKHIAALRRRIEELERKIGSLNAYPQSAGSSASEVDSEFQMRFTPKGLRSLRERLGLSAERFGTLIGVSGQSVYNWEHGVAKPRPQLLQVIASVRSIGKREALVRLESTATEQSDRQSPRLRKTIRRK